MRVAELGLYILFNEKLGLAPGEVTLLIAISIAPFMLKFLLAICSDSVTLCGSRRKSYLILSAIVNLVSIILLMVLGLKLGLVFIMACIVVANLSLTWLDLLDHALVAQAARYDLKNGSANLHMLAVYAYAIGGLLACLVAGSYEYNEYRLHEESHHHDHQHHHEEGFSLFGLTFSHAGDSHMPSTDEDDHHEGSGVDPNWYFGTYAVFALIVVIASFFVNPINEPEIIRMSDEDRKKLREDDELSANCSLTFGEIGRLFGYKKFFLPVLFFLLQGLVLPKFDDIHYIFLLEEVDMEKYSYTYLNGISYASLLLFTILYGAFFSRSQIWLMVEVSLVLFLAQTALMLMVVTRINVSWGISDEIATGVMFFLGS